MTVHNPDNQMAESRHLPQHSENQSTLINVDKNERTVWLIAGAALTVFGTAFGIARRNILGALLAAVGGKLLYSGTTGHSPIYRLLGINHAVATNPDAVSVPHEQGIHVSANITIYQDTEALYRYWRDLTNAPQIMSYLQSVEVLDEKRSRWTVKSLVGVPISWESEIINDIPNEVIAWRSLPGSPVANAGAVRFSPSYGNAGTNIQFEMEFAPPGGQVGKAVAKLFGVKPDVKVQEDLRRFKHAVESGEIRLTPAGYSWGAIEPDRPASDSYNSL